MQISSPEQAHNQINPNFSTRVEKIGEAIAIIYEGIPLNRELQMEIYNKTFQENPPTFDYIDLDTLSLIAGLPENEATIKESFEYYIKEGYVVNGIFTDALPDYKGLNFDQFKEKIKLERTKRLEEISALTPGAQIRPEHQSSAIRNEIFNLFGMHTLEYSQLFLK